MILVELDPFAAHDHWWRSLDDATRREMLAFVDEYRRNINRDAVLERIRSVRDRLTQERS